MRIKKELKTIDDIIKEDRELQNRAPLSLASLGSSSPRLRRSQFDLNKLKVLADSSSKELQRQVAENQSATNYFDSTVFYDRQNRMFKPITQKLDENSKLLKGLTDSSNSRIEAITDNLKNQMDAHYLNQQPIDAQKLALNEGYTGSDVTPFEIELPNGGTDLNSIGRFEAGYELGNIFDIDDGFNERTEHYLQLWPRESGKKNLIAVATDEDNFESARTFPLTVELLQSFMQNSTRYSDQTKQSYLEILHYSLGDALNEFARRIHVELEDEDDENSSLNLGAASHLIQGWTISKKFKEWIAPLYKIPFDDGTLELLQKKDEEEDEDEEEQNLEQEQKISEEIAKPFGSVTGERKKVSDLAKQAVEAYHKKDSSSSDSFDDDDKKGEGIEKKKSKRPKRPHVIIIPPNSNEQMQKLSLLLSSRKAGNNTGYEEFTALLDQLLSEKLIDKRKYRAFLKAWKTLS